MKVISLQIAIAAIVALSQSVRSRGDDLAPQPLVADASPLQATRNSQPSFLVRASVDRKSRLYRQGDPVKLTAVSERAGYLYALYQQADGAIYQIFPNSVQPNNRIEARQAIELPAGRDRFSWVVGPPFGREVIKIVVSEEPLTSLADPAMRSKLFNPVTGEQLKGMEVELTDGEPDQWAEFDVELTTQPASELPDGSQGKRIGVFFGVSHYEFNAEAEASSPDHRGMNLPTCHRDANQLAELMRDVGRLDDVLVCTNENATRAKFEEAVTRWLPSNSRPGDVVFIYFSGHGGQISDNDGDEKDHLDEVLIPHDYAHPGILLELLKRQKAGALKPTEIKRLVELLKAAGFSQGNPPEGATQESIGQNMARATGVSDDTFGHWLQTLDGRRIVVMLDICHAGGFATLEKGVNSTSETQTFDFLDRELARLKDIGQQDAAFLASSSAQLSSQCRSDDFPTGRGPLSVMTSYLIDDLLSPRSGVTVDQTYAHCRDGMAAYFSGKPPEDRHAPLLIGSPDERSTLLKP